jgi:hypothetical protein
LAGRTARAAEARNEVLARTLAEKAEAKAIADAYRHARLEEYRLRKAQTAGKQG